MAVDARGLTDAYRAIEPQLDALRERMERLLEEIASELGIQHPRIEGRVKTLDSLLLKTCRREVEGRPWQDPITQASDKVGLRVDVVYRGDVDRLVQEIVNADRWEGAPRVDDKEKALGVDKLGYQGVHIDVVPRDRPAGLDEAAATCEIQVRTNAQSAWAMGVHDLIYKGAPADDELIRQVNRLTVLLELVDKEVEDARDAILNGEKYPVVELIAELQRLRVHFTTETSDEALTRDVVTSLVQPADAHDLQASVQEFVAQNDDRVRDVLTRPGPPLARQPEALLVFMLLDGDPYAIQERWADAGFPDSILQTLAAEWGVTLPAPL